MAQDRNPRGLKDPLVHREEERLHSPPLSMQDSSLDSVALEEPFDIPLEKEDGARYEQLERLALHESVEDWDVYQAAHKSNEVCQHIFQQIQQDHAQLEPYHLSMLKKIITDYQKTSDYRGTSSAIRFWVLKQHLVRRG